MRVLAIDTSDVEGGIALIDNGKVYSYKIDDTRRVAENIYKFIDEFITRLNIGLSDISLFATILGPGSFTGLRVSLAVVKAFALSLNKPVLGVETFRAMAYQVLKRERDFEEIVTVGNARQQELFISIFSKSLDVKEEVRIIKAEEYKNIIKGLKNPLIAFREKELTPLFSDYNHLCLDKDLSTTCAEIALDLYKKGAFEDASDIEPVYVRNNIGKISH